MPDVPTRTGEEAIQSAANGAQVKATEAEVIARLKAALDDPESVPPMDVPPEVAEVVEMRIGDFPVTLEDRRRVTEDYCFQYHYGGKGIAFLTTSKGRVVIAHDEDEVSLLLKLTLTLPPREPKIKITLHTPHPW